MGKDAIVVVEGLAFLDRLGTSAAFDIPEPVTSSFETMSIAFSVLPSHYSEL